MNRVKGYVLDKILPKGYINFIIKVDNHWTEEWRTSQNDNLTFRICKSVTHNYNVSNSKQPGAEKHLEILHLYKLCWYNFVDNAYSTKNANGAQKVVTLNIFAKTYILLF